MNFKNKILKILKISFFCFVFNFNTCLCISNETSNDNIINLVLIICLLGQLMYYILTPIPISVDEKAIEEDNIIYKLEPNINLNSPLELDFFQFLNNYKCLKFIIWLFFFLILLIALKKLMVYMLNDTTSNFFLTKVFSYLHFYGLNLIKLIFIYLNIIICLFIYFLNNSIILCLSNDELSLPNDNGDKGLIVTCILISILVASCFLQHRNNTSTNNNSFIDLDKIDLSEIVKEDKLPKLTLDLKNEMLVYKDPIDPILPNPILVTIGVSIAIGMGIYYLYYMLRNHDMFKKFTKYD